MFYMFLTGIFQYKALFSNCRSECTKYGTSPFFKTNSMFQCGLDIYGLSMVPWWGLLYQTVRVKRTVRTSYVIGTARVETTKLQNRHVEDEPLRHRRRGHWRSDLGASIPAFDNAASSVQLPCRRHPLLRAFVVGR